MATKNFAMMRPKAKAEIELAIVRGGRGSIWEQEEALQKLISEYNKNRGTRKTGKTVRHIKAGYFQRKRARRGSHEAWMHQVINQPTNRHPHPFEVKA